MTKVITGLNTLPHAVSDCSVTSIERTHIEQPLYKVSSSLYTKSKNTKQTKFYNFISYISAESIIHSSTKFLKLNLKGLKKKLLRL